ncbi:type II toxin-antitoxin system HipA family toxin [Cupriavidus agavae]|uniref:Serine/threonine-protein kinase HipA n=1 Tax=Cupriavidus agavae TaxID=1001822 RepID=A0A4V2FI57_9BURK|nr:type II toxin-antitoxin system HipA family toxin [Cupriavidus agavae]RZT42619.1 serine/threonine-protein kinase HipA [Cupriavidus agavae]
MGRPSKGRAISVWTNGQRVGTWRIPARSGMEFSYDAAWMASAAGRPLSLSLPFGIDTGPLRGEAVLNYFDNLLPDSDVIRRRLAARHRTSSTDAFDLLAAIGRDCTGAVQMLGEDEEPENIERIEGTPLSDEDIETLLSRTVTAPGPLGIDEIVDFRVSIAGMQEKTALLVHGGQWMLPRGATPTTHILKMPIGLVGNRRADLTTSVENEWLCMQMVQALGLPAADCEMLTFGTQRVLSVKRFDRQMHSSGTWIMRLPQEDFCQALGLPSHLKYEADGGPGMTDLAGVLRQSVNAGRDLDTLLAAQIVFWMLAATDGHAKNFSIHLLPGGRFRLAPLYDIMSVWPIVGNGPNQVPHQRVKLAMAVSGKNRHFLLRDIRRRHFNAMARRCYVGTSAEPVLTGLLERLPGAIAEVAGRVPQGFPARVADPIFEQLEASADRLAAMELA